MPRKQLPDDWASSGGRWCAGWTDGPGFDRKERGSGGMFIRADEFKRGTRRTAVVHRTGRMMLHPLTEVGVRVLVAIRIGGGQFVMDVLGHRKGCQCQEDENQS